MYIQAREKIPSDLYDELVLTFVAALIMLKRFSAASFLAVFLFLPCPCEIQDST